MSPIFERRVQGGVGILEDHLQVPAQRPSMLPAGMADVVAFEGDAAGGHRSQSQDGPAQGGLAGAGLPHQAQSLALPDADVDVRQGTERLGAETLARVLDYKVGYA